MTNSGREIEAKFYVFHLDMVKMRLDELKAPLIQPRLLETNLRFDLPDGSLRSQGQVLRLRRDTRARLTYKGAGQNKNGVLEREEIEFIVEDFETARQFLEALGYQKTMIYEKYRATYEVDGIFIMLDELPFGDFVEVEGESMEQVQAVSTRLGLDWSAATGTSYTALFENIRKALQLSFQDLTFENFKGIQVTSDHLSVRAADG